MVRQSGMGSGSRWQGLSGKHEGKAFAKLCQHGLTASYNGASRRWLLQPA